MPASKTRWRLAVNNEVYLINRKDEFPGAKAGNRALIMAAIAKDPSQAVDQPRRQRRGAGGQGGPAASLAN